MKNFQIDSIEADQLHLFAKKYLHAQKPVVIRGLANSSPAGSKWTPEYLLKVCGDVNVDVYDNSTDNSASAYTTADMKMRFSEYFKTITANTDTTLRMFLFNMFRHRPELRKDFPCPSIFKGLLDGAGFMFFGAKGIKVRIHQDMDMSNVLLTQFHGRKKVVLVDPKFSKLLYKLPFNTHSLVDLDKPDYGKYPGLRYVETQECVIGPGDALFMPSGYWHYITYLDGGYSVSYRKMAITPAFVLRGVLSLCIYMPLDKLINRIAGPRWLAFKKRLAEKRANAEIEKIRRRTEAPGLEQVRHAM